MAMPTLEEFTKAVREDFCQHWATLTDEQVDEYLNGEEAQKEINRRYKSAVLRYNRGEISDLQFKESIASSVGYCLSLMY